MRKLSLLNRSRWQGLHPAMRHAIILGMLGITLLGSAIGSQLLGVFAHSPCASSDQVYTVVSGDTLGGIALRYRTTWWHLAAYNHIADANLIYPRQVICIPGHAQQKSGSGSHPVSRNQYVNMAWQDALNVGIPPDAFVRQINAESGFNPYAISPAGAIGIAQFMPGTAADLGINPYDPVSSLRAATGLMAHYVAWYGGDYAKALAAYNAGPGTVQWAVYRGGWYWRTYLPYETRLYLLNVLG